ncbi:GDP-mannose 4,6-dehydratase [Candidatus Woesebacteria bacterium]|nr:GDP-mannose 4,6-dehydratase [Candidatus Woesebacteria bacterium]
MKKILITGGTGFAGTHLVEHLLHDSLSEPAEIHVTHFGNKLPTLFDTFKPHQIHQVDLQDAVALDQLIKLVLPKEIYHLAAIASVSSSYSHAARVIQNNSAIQINILESVMKFVPEARLLVIGSGEEYGMSFPDELPITENHPFRPLSPYAVSKVTQDLLAYSYYLSRKLNILRVRPFNHTGEGQTVDFAIPSFASQIVEVELGKRTNLLVGSLDAKRDVSDVKDIVTAYQLVMQSGEVGEVYNIGSGQSVSMQAILSELVKLSTVKIKIETDPTKLRPTDIPEMVADITKISNLGWQPKISRDQTLMRVLHWWRTQHSN